MRRSGHFLYWVVVSREFGGAEFAKETKNRRCQRAKKCPKMPDRPGQMMRPFILSRSLIHQLTPWLESFASAISPCACSKALASSSASGPPPSAAYGSYPIVLVQMPVILSAELLLTRLPCGMRTLPAVAGMVGVGVGHPPVCYTCIAPLVTLSPGRAVPRFFLSAIA